MDWRSAQGLPWGIVLLFGGGFALASGFRESGLSAWVGERLAGAAELPPLLVILLICIVVTFLTELTSNTATAQILLPVLAALAVTMDVDPLLLMVPATISCSFAFMLPVATPPNAIVFGTERLRVLDMARVGFALNLIGALAITIAMWTLGRFVFGITP
jgi:sodium-dependent dicarboxylate transporter 2/3/5